MSDLVAVAIIVVGLAAVFSLWRHLMIRGVMNVVRIFRDHKALDPKRALTLEALGLQEKKGLFGTGMFRPRDYKQSAMHILGRDGSIKMVYGGAPGHEQFFLDEDALSRSRLSRFAGLK